MKNLKKPFLFVLSFVVLLALPYLILAANDKGMQTSAEHKNKVAEIVQELTTIAGKDENIGQEVSQVAQEENDNNEEMAAAMEKIENRGRFRTFLFGTDYKNIGAIRSQLVTTANHIKRLQNALARTEDEEVKNELNDQIAALEETKTNVENFIETNESKFSLLGWLVRLFNR